MSQGPQAGDLRESLGIPAGVVVEGMFTARQGTHLLDFGGHGSAHAPTFPAAAAATNVGGQGAHWTCATPSPAFSEKIPFIAGRRVGRPARGRERPAARAERCVRRLRRRRGHPRPARGGLRRRAARGLRPRHASGRRRPAARRHDALGRSRRRPRTAHRPLVAAQQAVRAARPVARASRRGRGRAGDGRDGRRPAHPPDALRAGRPGGRRRRRVPLPSAAVGLRHPSSRRSATTSPSTPSSSRPSRWMPTRSAASPRRTTSRPRSRAARSTPPIPWRRSTASRSPSPITRSRCR